MSSRVNHITVHRGKHSPQKVPPRRDKELKKTSSNNNGSGSNGYRDCTQSKSLLWVPISECARIVYHGVQLTTWPSSGVGPNKKEVVAYESFDLDSKADQFKILLPSSLKSEFLSYFSDLKNIHKVLDGLDKIWCNGKLFTTNIDEEMQRNFCFLLLSIANANKDSLKKALRADLRTDFLKEFRAFIYKKNINNLQKVIASMQALELVLLGVDPTNILANINNGRKTDVGGYINELQAGWFLAKFIYKFQPSDRNNLILSIELPEKEVDILTSDSIGEIKSQANNLVQLSKLVRLVLTNRDLRGRIKKIVLLKNMEKPKAEQGKESNYFLNEIDYETVRNESLEAVLKGLRDKFVGLKFLKISADGSYIHTSALKESNAESFDRLLSRNGFELHIIPIYDEFVDIENWIRLNYEILDREKRLELVA